MMEENNNNQVIHELTEQFDFSVLTETQKEMVLSEMSQSDYSDMREAVKNTLHFFETEPELIADDSWRPSNAKKHLVLRLINYKIPIYKVAAAAALLISINLYLSNKKEVETAVEVVKTDEVTLPDRSFTFEGIDDLKKHTSNNAIKYNKGLAKLY